MHKRTFTTAFQALHDKDMIVDGKLNPKLTIYPRDKDFKLTIDFILG